MTAVDAERAFAADAQTLGQWAAFRRWAAADAVMFVPQPVNAQTWLHGRTEPAHAVEWSPIASYQSCDGAVAVNTGEWRQADGSVGYFTTVWRLAAGGWTWLVDSGDALTTARTRVASPVVRNAVCRTRPPAVLRPAPGPGKGAGAAADNSLLWAWSVEPGGARRLTVNLWTGSGFETVLDDHIAPSR